MQYHKIVEYINSIPKFNPKNSMDHVRRFMELLGNPEENMKIIHVAGTNGKGSTCAYLHGMLLSIGKSVGMFTSPHLIEMTERIYVNDAELDRESFVTLFSEVDQVAKVLEKESGVYPTFFEFLFAMAMKAFERNKVEYVILETGLGGRLDATNAIKNPLVTILTSIALDHEQYLGSTLEAIAGEKAAILKRNAWCVYDDSEKCVSNVIEAYAKELNVKCKKLSDAAYKIEKTTDKVIDFSFRDAYDINTVCALRPNGDYQIKNAILAIYGMQLILELNQEELQCCKQALLETYWPGRMEEIEPLIYLDGAHNVAAIKAVSRYMKEVDTLIFSAVEDKRYEEMIGILSCELKFKRVILLELNQERGIRLHTLVDVFEKKCKKPIYLSNSIEEAFCIAKQKKEQNGKILCVGSLFLVGEVKRYRAQLKSS